MSDASPDPPAANPIPPFEEIENEITTSALESANQGQNFRQTSQTRSIGGKRDYVHLRGLSEHYWHKSLWSIFIAGIMAFMIGFQSVLLGLVGSGIWNFEKYTWLLPAPLAQNLAQIVGLAVFVMKALFKEMESK